jgi:transcriptional regulator with XRE-family HTH domain
VKFRTGIRVDVSLVIKQRLNELGLDQRDLATATQVTESYVSQLLTRKKPPPAPGRTDIYDRMGEFLKLPAGELSRLADSQRHAEMQKRMAAPPTPLFKECRELVLRKCQTETRMEVHRIFQKEPFGELERLVTQTLLDAAQGAVKDDLQSEERLRLMALASGRSYEQMRVAVLEFLDADVFDVTIENCVSFLDPAIESWDIDVKTFAMEVVLSRRPAPDSVKVFEFMERQPRQAAALEHGLEQFLKDRSLSSDATAEEIEFLKTLKFKGRRPSALYYYRELQNLRDPLNFITAAPSKERTKEPPKASA